MSALTNCPACKKEVAKSAKLCPHCGKKLKMGFFSKLVIGIFILIAIGIIASPSKEDKLAVLNKIANANAENIDPAGELANAFKLNSDFTDLQRDNIEKEIKGKIVQWSLPVYEVRKVGETYRIQTSGEQAIFSGKPIVGTFVTIHPKNDNEKTIIENLKTKDTITFKGVIAGTTMRNIDIDPAIIITNQ